MHVKVVAILVAGFLALGACTSPDGKPTEASDFFRRWGDQLRENARNRVTCYQIGNVINCY